MIDDLNRALAEPDLVRSFSGVRAIFGHGPSISREFHALAFAYGYCYAAAVLSAGEKAGESVLLLGRDPRPTGAAIVQAIAGGFLAGGSKADTRIKLFDLGIITTPLAETAIRSLRARGGVMVTASHNPIDHNGFKFLTGCFKVEANTAPAGALVSARAMAEVIAGVRSLAREGGDLEAHARAISPEAIARSLADPENESARVRAERAYLDVTGDDWGIAPHCLKPLTLGPVLLDPNGGAGCGIDARVLEHFGVRVVEVNAELGYPEHGIDTDGIDPASGRHMLLRIARAAARVSAHFGVAFDYDADRGNLVLPGFDESAIIPPQRAATFNIALALARRKLQGSSKLPLAVVASDATSLASHRVAQSFGAQVFQVETGEINVVCRMHELRREGYDVPVGVEGANGGTIFESATCRDGLQVALAAAQAESNPALAQAVSGAGARFDASRGVSLPELIDSVPLDCNVMFKLTAPPAPHGEIKRRLEQYFRDRLWTKLSSTFGSYEFENFEETRVSAERTGDESGAWRVMLTAGRRRAFIFLRGSRTESGVWRMIIDAETHADFVLVESAARELFGGIMDS